MSARLSLRQGIVLTLNFMLMIGLFALVDSMLLGRIQWTENVIIAGYCMIVPGIITFRGRR